MSVEGGPTASRGHGPRDSAQSRERPSRRLQQHGWPRGRGAKRSTWQTNAARRTSPWVDDTQGPGGARSPEAGAGGRQEQPRSAGGQGGAGRTRRALRGARAKGAEKKPRRFPSQGKEDFYLPCPDTCERPEVDGTCPGGHSAACGGEATTPRAASGPRVRKSPQSSRPLSRRRRRRPARGGATRK